MKVTLSVIKADIGGYVGHSGMHPALMELAENELRKAKEKGTIIDFFVTHAGDDLELIFTHTKGKDNPEIHEIAWNVFKKGTEKAKELGLYGAGQDILSDTFSGNVKGMGPGVAEMELEERPSEPVIVFMADKTSPGAWNFPLFKIFADPFNTAGLIIDPKLHDGFIFNVLDLKQGKSVDIKCPSEMYDLLALIGSVENYVIKEVYRYDGEIAAVSSTQRLALIAGKYVGKDDPVMIVRTQSGFPAVGEVLEPFATAHMVPGWMRGSHWGPLMPVSMRDANCTRFDGPPRVISAGFQLTNGKLVGPKDLFDDPAFDITRQKALEITDYIRRMGPFEPQRLGLEEMEYTTLPSVLRNLETRFKSEKE